MKVLHYVSIMDRAGQETFIMNLYRNINRDEIQFGFLCSENRHGDYDDEIHSLGGEINHVLLNRKQGKLRHIDNYFILKNELKKYSSDYDVFHIHNHHAFDSYMVARAALKAGFKKVIVHSHSSSAEEHVKLHELFKKPLSNLNITKLACSDSAGEWMFSTNDYILMRNGIDVNKFAFSEKDREQYRKELNISDKFVIGHIGRFMYVKNHKFLVKLFAEYKKVNENACLMLVGGGEDFDKIKELVFSLGISDDVLFLGVREDTPQLYCAMDMFILPSHFEGLGIVAIEAQNNGLCCLISDTVSNQAEITNNVLWAGLNEPMSKWIKQIEDIRNRADKNDRTMYCEQIRNAGYDIHETCVNMSRIYKN